MRCFRLSLNQYLILSKQILKNCNLGNSLAVQRLGVHTSTAAGWGSIPGWGTKILQNALRGQKKKNCILYCHFRPGWISRHRIYLKQLNKETKYMKQWFSGIGQQAVHESDLWEKGANKVNPMIAQATG